MRPSSIAAGVVAGALVFAATACAEVRILGFWWENPLPYQATPKGLTTLSAAQCGVCHQEIYQEWLASTHAQALADKQFQAEMSKSPETNWLCLNCHTPLENQLAQIAIGVTAGSTHQPILKKNARFDAALSPEGVTCAVCHVKNGVVLGPYGDSKAPHPVRREPRLLDERACGACHQATAAYTDTLVCTFDTAEEWRASLYGARRQYCSHCHMPEVERPVAVGGPVRKSRRHLFLGSKIPKLTTLPENQRQYYDLYPNGLSVDIVNEKGLVKLVLKNARAGHLLPTGDPERFILVKAEMADSAGRMLDRQTYRIGQEWVWYPQVRKISDNRLKPLEERQVELRFSNPRHVRATLVRVTVENWRLSQQNAAYHKLTGVYPQSAVVLRLEKPLP
ncbi:MAG: hypothetical protein HY236_06755 [Acidobacteria bacterium]|nr:hypothetical protein [Acidobacteriota bacterium]